VEEIMEIFDKQKYSSLLVKGNLHDAIKYIERFADQADLLNKYKEVFMNNKDVSRYTNNVINELDKIYQKYYRDVFWYKENLEKAEASLFKSLWVFCGENENLEKNSQIELEVEKIVRKEGYEFLGGDTAGYYGPYIWETSNKETYEVELPSGVEEYSIIMMDGFISRSWLDFLSFGKVGTGGWSGKDGTLCCIKSLYDIESQVFKISFLKHEAQHSIDKKLFSKITSSELEYRAKLVELVYWEDEKIIRMIHLESENSDERNTHSSASHRIISDLSRKLFNTKYEEDLSTFLNKLDEVRIASRELLIEDTNRLSE
jgi:hypothetical protein